LGGCQIRAENLAADNMVLQDRGQVCALQQFFFSDIESFKERCKCGVSWSKHCEGSWPTQRIDKFCLLKCLHENCESAIANSRVDDTGRCRSRRRQEDSIDGMDNTIAAQHISYHDCCRPCHHRCPITCNCERISCQGGYILGGCQIRAENLAADNMVLQDRGQVCALQQFFFSDIESFKERCKRSVSWSKHCEGSWPTQRLHKSCLLKCLYEDCESAIANSCVDDTGRCRSWRWRRRHCRGRVIPATPAATLKPDRNQGYGDRQAKEVHKCGSGHCKNWTLAIDRCGLAKICLEL